MEHMRGEGRVGRVEGVRESCLDCCWWGETEGLAIGAYIALIRETFVEREGGGCGGCDVWRCEEREREE